MIHVMIHSYDTLLIGNDLKRSAIAGNLGSSVISPISGCFRVIGGLATAIVANIAFVYFSITTQDIQIAAVVASDLIASGMQHMIVGTMETACPFGGIKRFAVWLLKKPDTDNTKNLFKKDEPVSPAQPQGFCPSWTIGQQIRSALYLPQSPKPGTPEEKLPQQKQGNP